jgi:hypothetical protein
LKPKLPIRDAISGSLHRLQSKFITLICIDEREEEDEEEEDDEDDEDDEECVGNSATFNACATRRSNSERLSTCFSRDTLIASNSLCSRAPINFSNDNMAKQNNSALFFSFFFFFLLLFFFSSQIKLEKLIFSFSICLQSCCRQMASLAGDIESLYEFGPELGRGEFSTVILGTDKKSGEQVAIKIIEKNEMDTSRLETEVMILKKVCNIYRELYTCTCVYIRVRVYV